MQKHRAMHFTIIVFFVLSIVYGCGSAPSGGNVNQESTPKAKVFIYPASNTVNPGDILKRTVELENIGNTFYTAFDITYDPNIIEYIDSGEGSFLNRNGIDATYFQVALQDGKQGRITVGLTRLGKIGDVSGNGALLSLTFRAVSTGSSSLVFANPKSFKNSNNQGVTVEDWGNGTVTVE